VPAALDLVRERVAAARAHWVPVGDDVSLRSAIEEIGR
jgi:hypothetical protein